MKSAILTAILVSNAAAQLAQAQTTERLQFEVASVKPAAPLRPGGPVGPEGGPGTRDPVLMKWSYTTLLTLIMTAYRVQPHQIVGPAWIGQERFDVVAKVPRGATTEQTAIMLQKLIAERWGVRLRHISKVFDVNVLTVARGGLKIKENTLSEPNVAARSVETQLRAPGGPKQDKNGFPELAGPRLLWLMTSSPNGPEVRIVARAQTMGQFADMLSGHLNESVVDRTGLHDKYDFSIEFAPEPGTFGTRLGPEASGESAGLTLAGVLQRNLGLTLHHDRAPLDTIAIDHANRVPSAN